MPTKTERILSYLPETFRAGPSRSALRAVVDAFGRELLAAENSLAALMRAHWVDHADKGAEEIDDLARLAALYGLAPRPDEGVEEFREHLKRYIRTFLEGTVTVQGVLRIAAEALGLTLADAPEELDSWWRRGGDPETVPPSPDGSKTPTAGGEALPATVTGSVPLTAGADLQAGSVLRLSVDGGAPVDVDLAAGAGDPSAVRLDEMVAAIKAALGPGTASHDGRFLTLASPTVGAESRLEVGRAPGDVDASETVLGLVSRVREGRGGQPARVTGTVELAGAFDLSEARYLRLLVDGSHLAEIDCAGSDPSATTLDEVRDKLNAAFPFDVASHDGRFLTLTSRTTGTASSLGFQSPAARDARRRLFGPIANSLTGSDPEPARFTGSADLSEPVDLSAGSKLRIRIDDEDAVTVDVTGSDPSATTLDEIAGALKAALGEGVVTHDGRRLTLTSSTHGAEARIAVLRLPAGDASEAVFGLRPRTFHGRDAVPVPPEPPPPTPSEETVGPPPSPTGVERRPRFLTRAVVTREAATALFGFVAGEARGEPAKAARVAGTRDLSAGVDLSTDSFLRLAVDGEAAVDIDCAGPRPRTTTLDEAVAAINAALPFPLASHDGRTLSLTSPTRGGASRIVFETPRAHDALEPLGLEAGTVRGFEVTRVSFTSTVELVDGVDLEEGAAVRIGVDGEPVDVELAPDGPVHLGLAEIAAAINAVLGKPAAGQDGRRLSLRSSRQGEESVVELAVPEGADVTAALFGIEPPRTYRGLPPRPARVEGDRDLGESVAFERERLLLLSVDGEEARITLGGVEPTPPDEILETSNDAFAEPVASLDDGRLVLTSHATGTAGRITLTRHETGDARRRLFGDPPERTDGAAPAPAVLTGEISFEAPADLSDRRRLRLAVDGGTAIEIDAAGPVPGRTFPDEAVSALNAAVPGIASITDDGRLRLTSPTAGAESRIALLPLRWIEVEEYLPEPAEGSGTVRHGGRLRLDNDGAGTAAVTAEISAPHGTHGPTLADPQGGWTVRLAVTLDAGETARIRRRRDGTLRAEVVHPDAGERPVSDAAISVAGVAEPLVLPRGRSRWQYLECTGDRFDEALFGAFPVERSGREGVGGARFAGEPCTAWAVFDVSRFAAEPSEGEPVALFAPSDPPPDPPVELTLRWRSHRPGTFRVRLPADLHPRFGGRFDEVRFASAEPEVFPDAVFEPPDDPRHLVHLLADSRFVEAAVVPRVPLGFQGVEPPFRKPRRLTLGDPEEQARMFLILEGLDGALEIRAREPGVWGNEIAVATRRVAPARYEVSVQYSGAVFENARLAVRGDPLPSLAEQILAPGAVGVLQAKAAGLRAEVTRHRAESPEPGV